MHLKASQIIQSFAVCRIRVNEVDKYASVGYQRPFLRPILLAFDS